MGTLASILSVFFVIVYTCSMFLFNCFLISEHEFDDDILPFHSSSSSPSLLSSILRRTTLVLHKCASYITSFLNPSTTSGDQEQHDARIENLPSEVLLHIFSFLPVSSLGQLVRVSKKWSDLLRDQNNMDFILDRKSPNRQSRNPMYLLGRNNPQPPFTELYILESRRDFSCCASSLEIGRLMIINTSTSSGFICCSPPSKPSELFLCNPLTREFARIPDHPKMKAVQKQLFKNWGYGQGLGLSHQEPSSSISMFGMGIDLTNKKQSKLVGLYSDTVRHNFVFECYVYTIGSNSWRSVGETIRFIPSGGDAVFHNWTLHWLVRAYCSSSLLPILAFDLETEKLRLLSPPHVKEGHISWFSYMTELGEKLSYVCQYNTDTRVHVLEDDAKMVWSLRYCLVRPVWGSQISDHVVYGVWPGNALFLRRNSTGGLYWYRPDDGKEERLFYHACWDTQYNYVVGQYHPSCVSPRFFWTGTLIVKTLDSYLLEPKL